MSGYDTWKAREPDPHEFDEPPADDEEPDTSIMDDIADLMRLVDELVKSQR